MHKKRKSVDSCEMFLLYNIQWESNKTQFLHSSQLVDDSSSFLGCWCHASITGTPSHILLWQKCEKNMDEKEDALKVG